MRVCYFGGYDRQHPRNRVMMLGLAQAGAEVVECHSRHPFKPLRIGSLCSQLWRNRKGVDVVIVGAACHGYVPWAWVLCRLSRKPLVFDAFVSRFENWQEEHPKGWPDFWRGPTAWWADKISVRLPDLVLLDTEEHAAYFRKAFDLAPAKAQSVPVGAADFPAAPGDHPKVGLFKVLFVGSFLPLHGTEVIVQAAERLAGEPGIVLELLGKKPIPRPEYLRRLLESDAALGAFGITPKTDRVIPCKVYDALAGGVPVITADTSAVRRLLRHNHNALLVPPGDPQALADAILRLKKDPALRASLATEGRRTLEATATPEKIGRRLLSLLADIGVRRA